jgi:hypothetical protein
VRQAVAVVTSARAKGWILNPPDAADLPVASQGGAGMYEPTEVHPVDEDGDVLVEHQVKGDDGTKTWRAVYVDATVLVEVLRRAGWRCVEPNDETVVPS